MSRFPFDNTYVRDLPGFYVPCVPEPAPAPELLYFNAPLAERLGLNLDDYDHSHLARLFSGNEMPGGAEPIAQVYAGHQFGQYSPQLGDGRALLLGELVNPLGERFDISYKGSGRTPFSRGGDGKAAVGPMLREVLVGEAMAALGVPTTRSLAVVKTGAPVYRDQVLPGAILTRVAASHIRVGTFEFFAARGEQERVRQLADYSIRRHAPDITAAQNPYLEFLRAVTLRQAGLLAQWMSLGFIHGVMNTDNMSIAGETIDYGPCAYMEAYHPDTVFSSIDHHGRYAYKNQPRIAQWNLARLAETLLPLLANKESVAMDLALEVVTHFQEAYQAHWLSRMRAKLGLRDEKRDARETDDTALIEAWLGLLQAQEVDFTLAHRKLADAAEGNPAPLLALFSAPGPVHHWLQHWQARCAAADLTAEGGELRAAAMRRVNPWLIPRNHWVEAVLAMAANEADLAPFEQFMAALQNPWDENPAAAAYATPAPAAFTDSYRTFCGT